LHVKLSILSSTADDGLAYSLTTNTTYPPAYANANLPWFSFFPFANWDNFYAPAGPVYPNISPVQDALIETLTLAQPLSPLKGTVFIDFANYSKFLPLLKDIWNLRCL
jgi:hypothetical protein